MINTVCRLLAMKSKYSKIQVGKKLKQKYIQDKSYLDICKLRSLHMLICRYNIITLKLTYIKNNKVYCWGTYWQGTRLEPPCRLGSH